MSESTESAPGSLADLERIVGRVRGDRPGPALIALGGIHGNEPGGVIACKRVVERLRRERIPMHGELLALAGNVAALRARRRFLQRDLNRQWTEDGVLALDRHDGRASDAEAFEQRELRRVLEDTLLGCPDDVYFLDLHTTSAEGVPFALIGDTLAQRAFARHFPLPVILGLEEQVDGVLVEYMTRRGCITLVCEGGQHDNPRSWDSLEALLWLALVAAGLVRREALPDLGDHYRHLDRARGDLPRVMEVLSRHGVEPADEFRMEPGFANICRVREGQLLARSRGGPIRARRDGMLMLPLYQPQGEDGFFLGREVSPWRLHTSSLARRLELDRLLPCLPGVRRDPTRRDQLDVDTAVARLYPREIFHLFGYRKIRQREGRLEVARRPHDPE